MIKLIIGILSLIYFIALKVGGISFSQFFLAAGLFFIIWEIFSKNLKYKFPKISLLLNVSVLLLFVSFLIIEGFIIIEGNKKDLAKSDYVLVLGAGLWGDTPSDTLYKRLDGALQYLKINPEVKVIVSGGMGPGETITEAEAMKSYLVKKGIPEKNIIKEEESRSTEENINNSKELLIPNNKDNITVTLVTSNFHMLRSKLLAEKAGFKTYEYSAPILSWLIPVNYVREYFAMVKYLVFSWR